MRILLISGSYPPIRCGVGDYTSILASELASSGISAGVLTSSDALAEAAAEGVEVMPLLDNWRLWQLPRIVRMVTAWRPDLVHIQYPAKGYGKGKAPLLLPLLLGLRGIPVVQTWHEPLGWLRRLRYLPCAVTRDTLIVVEPDYNAFVPAWFGRILHRKRFLQYIPVGSNIPSVALSEAERLRLRGAFATRNLNLIAYFGFVAPLKGLEALFEAADPDLDRLLLICDLDPSDSYQKTILDLADSDKWHGKVLIAGFRPSEEVAKLLSAADIAVFPFVAGVTNRNASVLAARTQGTFVLTTSLDRHGYIERENSYYARPGDLSDLRQALRRYAGQKAGIRDTPDWTGIAELHLELYGKVLLNRQKSEEQSGDNACKRKL